MDESISPVYHAVCMGTINYVQNYSVNPLQTHRGTLLEGTSEIGIPL